MRKADADQVVENMLSELEAYYVEARRQLAEHEATARMTIRKWAETGAYRKKGNETPHVSLYSPQHAYMFGLRNWRQIFKFPPETKP